MLRATLVEGKRFHHSANFSPFTFSVSFCYLTMESGFPPEIKTGIFGVMVLVQCCSKESNRRVYDSIRVLQDI